MMEKHIKSYIRKMFGLMVLLFCFTAEAYENFDVAVYSRAYETRQMADIEKLERQWGEITRQVHVDKIYLETYRDAGNIVDERTLNIAKKFFADKGVKTAGGITLTVSERNRFETFCYSNPEHRQKVREIVEYTAGHFDEVILDDFFFTNCKCELCIKAKGDKSWTQYRLALLDEAARELIVKPARAVNPNVKIIIKYPNWYEHFQGLGFNLETQPEIFDGLYTGTETRDPVRSHQHLQQYLGYLIFRYFENIKSGGNRGGWVDTGGMAYIDRYAEQLWLTLFAKAPEVTLFDFRQIQRRISKSNREPWHDLHTSFDFDEMLKSSQPEDGTSEQRTTIARAAGYTFEMVDKFLGRLGNPVGVKCYKPYHSTGEDFLHNYLGMCGIAMDLVPEFPTDANIVFLAESAKFDAKIVDKMKAHLISGKDVVITSGLLKALQGKGIEDIVELEYTDRKAVVRDFVIGWGGNAQAKSDIIIPQIMYLTNDSWEEITCSVNGIGYPVLHSADYANGTLYVMTIPENFGDLYNLPDELLTRYKELLNRDIYVRVEGPAHVSIFVYDNDTFIVESFLHETADVDIVVTKPVDSLHDLLTNEVLTTGSDGTSAGSRRMMTSGRGRGRSGNRYSLQIKPHSFRVFQCQ